MSGLVKSVSPHADAIANELASELHGKLDQPKIDAVVAALKAPAASQSANATTICLIFYTHVAGATPGHSFSGNAGGICVPPGGSGAGTLYSDNFNSLFSQTVSFSFVAAVAYLGIQFYDSHHNLLGHYEGGGVYTPGTGGGTMSWS